MTSQATVRTTADILVIDDDTVIRTLVEAYLTKAGFCVRTAASGKEGLASFERDPAGVVLVDVRMPEMNGYQVCENLRATATGRHVPVLIMTGTESLESVEEAFEAGATDFATKPLNLGLLVHRLRYMLRTSRTAEQLREREQNLLDSQRIAGLGGWTRSILNGRFTLSDVLVERLGLQSASLDHREFIRYVHPEDQVRIANELDSLAENEDSTTLEFRWMSPMGADLFLNMEAYEQSIAQQHRSIREGLIQDITEQRRAESQIRNLAYYDPTTKLANRTMLQEQLQKFVSASQRDQSLVGILLIDLDHFKRINDTWGHQTGDHVLTVVAQRLTNCIQNSDLIDHSAKEGFIGRMGGDEFVVLASGLTGPEDAAMIADRINRELAEPLQLHETGIVLNSSIGISISPDNGTDAHTLLRQADGAMYDAKQRGRDGYRFFTPEIQARAYERLTMEIRIREALGNDEFLLHFQPKITLDSGRIDSLEALVRWGHPKLGLISPGDFIPIAEDSGLIVPLGQWVLETACAETKQLQSTIGYDIGVSVNLSAMQMRQPNLVEMVHKAITKSGLAPGSLELELTESILMQDVNAPTELLDQLKALGIKLSIDDFGTGYSSLSYLKRFPIDSLKIDQSFIRDLETDSDDAAIVDAAITLAHKLRLSVVAEGVETAEQEAHLRQLDCDEVQGYYYSRPLPMNLLIPWLREKASESAAPAQRQ
ncbi:MAG: EAL domain-containing protein [Burkholderiaceae bacterium]